MGNFRNYILRIREKLIIVASTAVLLAALYNVYTVLGSRLTSNDECLWSPTKTSKGMVLHFDFVKKNGVTWNAGIRDGDQLLAINGIPIKSDMQAQNILDKVKAGNYAEYKVKSGDKVFTTKVLVKKLVRYPDLANSLLGLFWLIIGFIVLLAKPDGKIQKIFYAVGIATVLSVISLWLPMRFTPKDIADNPVFYGIIAYLWSLSICFLPFLLLYFFWIFPKQFKFLEKKWLQISMFAIPIVLFLITFFTLITTFGFEKNYIPFGAWRTFLNTLVGAANVIAWISLIVNYRRLKTKEEKKPIFIILIAFTVGLVASIYTSAIAPAITDTMFNQPEYYAPIILNILVPVAFGYSIFKYQLLDVSIVVKNSIVYGLATITLAAIYFLFIYAMGQGISSAIGTQYQGIIAGIVFVVFAMVFQSTREKFQDYLTSKFYPEQFAAQKVLMSFSNTVSTVVGLDNILDSMKNTYVNALGINHLAIFLSGENDKQFKCMRGKNMPGNFSSIEKEGFAEFIVQRFSDMKKAIIQREEFNQAFPENINDLLRAEIYTVIPMKIKSKIIGLLLFGLKHSGSQFAGKDLDLLYATAGQAAIAIENARLYKTEAEKHKIERDLELARKIQQGLLPKCIPSMKGLQICGEMHPAMQVGGDYFDLIPVSRTKLFVVVGDVSGKGLGAAIYMTKLQTMIQLACSFDKKPKEILIDVNRRMYESFERNSFVTVTLALFDTDKNNVIFCRAGHMPLLTAKNGNVTEYKTKGLGIGLDSGDLFQNSLVEEEISLTPGQLYAFFSDGVTEAMNSKNDLFGEENLTALLKNKSSKTPGEVMDEIWESVKQFRGDAEPNDDMTMVLVKVT